MKQKATIIITGDSGSGTVTIKTKFDPPLDNQTEGEYTAAAVALRMIQAAAAEAGKAKRVKNSD